MMFSGTRPYKNVAHFASLSFYSLLFNICFASQTTLWKVCHWCFWWSDLFFVASHHASFAQLLLTDTLIKLARSKNNVNSTYLMLKGLATCGKVYQFNYYSTVTVPVRFFNKSIISLIQTAAILANLPITSLVVVPHDVMGWQTAQ